VPRVVISGYYGFGNWGDEAILEAAAEGLARAIPDLELTVLSNDPTGTRARHGLAAVHRLDPVAVWSAVRSADLLVTGGGSLLQDVTSSRSLWYYLSVIALALGQRRKVMLYANGVGPINRAANRVLTREVLDRVDLITVRGPDSKRYLEELGVARPRTVVTADAAFALEPAPPERVAAIAEAEGLPQLAGPEGPERWVGIALRPWPGSEGLETPVAAAADRLVRDMGLKVLLLPVQRASDLPVAERVKAAMRRPSAVLRGAYTAREVVGLLGRLRFVVSMRLHPLVFAAVGGVPGIGLSYDPKVEEFALQTGQPTVGPLGDVTARDLLAAVGELEATYRERVGRLREVVRGLRERAALNNTLAADLLRSV